MDISPFDVTDICDSSYSLILGKRRSGKSVLVEYLINQMKDKNMIDICFLFSETNAGFDNIEKESRFTKIDKLKNIVDNFKKYNEYNKVASKEEQIKIKAAIIIDDFAVKLKSKSFNILESLAVNGRHCAYGPSLSLHFFILCQSLTKIPRVVRLNSDMIFLNAIASLKELELILDENFYIIRSDVEGRREGRQLYQDLVTSEPFQFIVIENYRQNVTSYNDYIKTYKAVL